MTRVCAEGVSNLAISWSSLRSYEECNHRHLRRSQGKATSAIDGRIFLPGTVADRVMREWLETPDPRPGEMVHMVEGMMERFCNPQNEDDRNTARVIRWRGDPVTDRQIVTNFVRRVVRDVEPFLVQHVVPHFYQPELRFRTTVGIPFLDGRLTAVDLVGGIDIVVQNKDTEDFSLYDLKATENDDYVRTVLGQGVFYDIGFGNWWGDQSQPKEFAFLTPACKEKVVYARITDEERRHMMTRIINMAHGIWRKEWDPTEADGPCYNCDVKHACDKWKLDLKQDSQGKHRVSFEDAAARRRKIPA